VLHHIVVYGMDQQRMQVVCISSLVSCTISSQDTRNDLLQNPACAPQVGLPEPVVLAVAPATVQLLRPQVPQLSSVLGAALPPWVLLRRLSQCGLHLLPQDRDAEAMGWHVKEAAAERAMCEEVAGVW
jgi:hypothetical protein